MNTTELTLPSYVFDNALYEAGMTADGGPWDKLDGWDKDAVHKFAELVWIASKRDSALTELTRLSQEMGGYD